MCGVVVFSWWSSEVALVTAQERREDTRCEIKQLKVSYVVDQPEKLPSWRGVSCPPTLFMLLEERARLFAFRIVR